ncbi:hypothetical protein Pmani_005900 [Petrolisthes manimaculis]|uniref:AN1-type domain-containing protein n=1 Tax=Petrolisthes manimaculis TaxID=1843537 RepID=A0AAE1UK40_9EUCA|nr:hypothetical protein Pmani_005900 [Petrolisthes manimaculis]
MEEFTPSESSHSASRSGKVCKTHTHTQERMEFPDLGQQCQVSSCSQLDFLPIKCHFCGESYCKHHFLPQQHKCIGENDQAKTTEIPESPGEKVGGKKYLCEVKGCRGWELAPVICPACTNNFCLAHRHQADHECSSYQLSENPMSQAAMKIQEITNRLDAADSKKGQGRKSDKLAAKVQLMKLKQRSSGKSGLPQEERLYFLVMLPKGSPTTSLPVFVSHHWVVGVAVDNIASLAKLPNRNNVVGADKLVLFRTSDGSQTEERGLRLASTDQNPLIFPVFWLCSEVIKTHMHHTGISSYTDSQHYSYYSTINEL